MKEKAFDSLECQGTGNGLHRIRQLQQEQLVYGPHALVPDTVQTYEEVIQSLVAENLRQQYEARRERKGRDTHQNMFRHRKPDVRAKKEEVKS